MFGAKWCLYCLAPTESAQVRELQGKYEETPPVSKTKEVLDQIANSKCESLVIAGV